VCVRIRLYFRSSENRNQKQINKLENVYRVRRISAAADGLRIACIFSVIILGDRPSKAEQRSIGPKPNGSPYALFPGDTRLLYNDIHITRDTLSV